MAILQDPKFFNYAILALSICAAARWTLAMDWWQALYWTSAALIAVAVTGMAK